MSPDLKYLLFSVILTFVQVVIARSEEHTSELQSH